MTAARRLIGDRAARIGMVVLGLAVTGAVLAPWLAPADPLAQTDVLLSRLLPPLTRGPDGVWHWLGTDRFGRDVLSRLLFGARISMVVGVLSVVVSLLIGVGIGVGAAMLGGRTERVLMGVTDAALALPRLVLLLALVALFEPGLTLVVLVIGGTGWMGIARLARAEVRVVLTQPFVDATRASGLPMVRVVWRHLLPNSATPVIVAGALAVGNAITLESGLSFLGLGVPLPAPSWGNMIAGGREALVNAPWIASAPGLAIVAVVIATNLLGDGLQHALAAGDQDHNMNETTSRGRAVNST